MTSDAQNSAAAACRDLGLRVYALADESVYPGAVILSHSLGSRSLDALAGLAGLGWRIAPCGRRHIIVTATEAP